MSREKSSPRSAAKPAANEPPYSKLPGPAEPYWEWQLHGACRGLDSSVFFHPDGERGRVRAKREQRAKAICRECPVMNQCLAHSLEADEPYGIWGGLGETERAALLRPTARTRHHRQKLDPEHFPQYQDPEPEPRKSSRRAS